MGSAQAQAPAQRSFEAVYTVSANIGPVGDFTYRFNQTGAAYEANARREVTGLARALVGESQNYTYSVRGAVAADGRLQPAAYRHQGGKKNRLVQAPSRRTISSRPRLRAWAWVIRPPPRRSGAAPSIN